ncbi:MAG: pirin family protein [Acidobacteriota bacterium]
MVKIRPGAGRGETVTDWLVSYHTFSFNEYYDPEQMGFRSLRVINEDYIKPGAGFPTHSHRDMEILTYMLEGAIAHRDSLGNGSIIGVGELQRMSAGVGISHSEFNNSQDKPAHLLQIWIQPKERGQVPSYEQRRLDPVESRGQLRLIASPNADDGTIMIHQDAWLYLAMLAAGEQIVHKLAQKHYGWIQVARGEIILNNTPLMAGDGAAVTGESIVIQGVAEAQILLFELA